MRNMTILQFTIGIGWAFGPFISDTLASPDIVSSFDMNTPFIFMMGGFKFGVQRCLEGVYKIR